LNTTLMPHSIIPGDACFAYFNKIWGILKNAPAHGLVAGYFRLGAFPRIANSGRHAGHRPQGVVQKM
jgi:hypothetical protein